MSGINQSHDDVVNKSNQNLIEDEENEDPLGYNRTPKREHEHHHNHGSRIEEQEEDTNQFSDLFDVIDIKSLLQRDECGISFNNNILKIALNLKEEKIASVLVADY